ncbi:MAG: sigma-70 family RNA polymerase sigma factor [Verrucomicrobia bacterium]|nr:sigma-70 family RNA polymerase sigma factor [Verrucomicrobiota bacterium]
METPDCELIAQYRQGDVVALDRLIDRHQRMLFGYIVNMTGHQDGADDVFQEVWLKVIRKLDGYRDQNFGGWLVRIARNVVIDRVRRRKPELSLDQEDADGRGLARTLAAETAPPPDELADRDLGARIAQAVALLPEEQREVFVMRVKADLAFKEIARLQGVSINTALARMQYALTKLRPLLQQDYKALGTG